MSVLRNITFDGLTSSELINVIRQMGLPKLIPTEGSYKLYETDPTGIEKNPKCASYFPEGGSYFYSSAYNDGTVRHWEVWRAGPDGSLVEIVAKFSSKVVFKGETF